MITAPLSRRTKRSNNSNSSIRIMCAVISAIVAFGGTYILSIAMISSSSTTTNTKDVISARTGISTTKREGSSLRQSSIANNIIETTVHGNIPNTPPPQGLIIHTHIGEIRIHFTPELAGESSIKYITNVVQSASSKRNSGMTLSAETTNGRKVTDGYKCQRCKFYRAEKDLLLQGVIAEPTSTPKNKVLGQCPDTNYIPKNKCPDHDPQCGCHGPIMTKGMVGWAGGGGGPDFFINTFQKPVDWWEMQHTVWGMIRDEKSMEVVESAYDLPVHGSGMKMLDEEIEISLELF